MKISSFDAFFESEEKKLTKEQEEFLNSVCKLSGSTWSYENGLVNVSGSFDASYNQGNRNERERTVCGPRRTAHD